MFPLASIRAIAQQYIPGLIEEGFRNTEIARILRGQGLSYRAQNMFRDINLHRLEAFGTYMIQGLTSETPIPDRFMRERELKLHYKYAATIKYSYLDTDTGMLSENATTFYFNIAPTEAEVATLYNLKREELMIKYPNRTNFSDPEHIYYYRNITVTGK